MDLQPIKRIACEVINTAPTQPCIIRAMRRVPRIKVSVAQEPSWQEKGWRHRRGKLQGRYTLRGTQHWNGKVEDPFDDEPQFFIQNPPAKLLDGDHGACFWRKHRNLFYVHFAKQPKSLIDGIIQIEHCLKEVY